MPKKKLKPNSNKKLLQIQNKCIRHFSFHAIPENTKRKNFNTVISTASHALNTQPTNLAFHNLCITQQLPIGTWQLLGLNLKYCLSPNTLNGDINSTLLKLAYAIRTRYSIASATMAKEESTYIPQIYQRNKNWNPPPAPIKIEKQLTCFEESLKQEHAQLSRKYQGINLSYLTPLQAIALKKLWENKNIIIKKTDKNLGPVVMEKDSYIHQILTEHLLTKPQEATHRLKQLKITLRSFISDNQGLFSQSELIYFERSLKNQYRIPLFYGLPKVHKNPVTLHPIVSTTNSLLAIFSHWLDYRMKKLLPLVHLYTKKSAEIVLYLKKLTLPRNTVLFSADAKSMYTNIDTDMGITAIRNFPLVNSSQISANFPTQPFLQILEIVMKNNIFAFQDTHWLQLSGTAMGRPAACAYATITYGHYKNTEILPRFSDNLLYYKRCIDDTFGIWIPSAVNNSSTWESFKRSLNNWGNLEWLIEEPSKVTNFLDLILKISNLKITTKTFQKQMNLYLYIPEGSAHPPSCLKGLIIGESQRYWLQNNKSIFITILSKFIQCLTERGHKLESLIPLFNQAVAAIDTKAFHPSPQCSNSNEHTLYLHWQYHPKGIQRSSLCRLYDEHLAPFLNYNKMVIAISRPLNLRDLLVRAALATESPGNNQATITRH
jgi:hypothetical protein